MDRKLLVRRHGEHFHLNFHDFMGSFEGHAIGKWLDLTELEGAAQVDSLQPGQFYLEHVMERHPDLHALVARERLRDVAKACDHFHVTVIEGAELLPKLAPEEKEAHLDVSFVDQLEKQHASAWSKGPRAFTSALLLRAIPAIVVIAGIVIASRHFSDAREEVEIAELFRRAARPQVEQSWLSGLVSPDHSHELITSIAAVRFIEGERLILKDGILLQFAGMRDVKPMLEAAREAYTVPKIEVALNEGKVLIRNVRVGNREFGAGSELRFPLRLPASVDAPTRSGVGGVSAAELALNPKNWLEKRVPLRGVMRSEGGGFVLDPAGEGPDLALKPARAGGDIDLALQEFANGKTELIVDVLMTLDRRDGRALAKLLMLSAQNYHLRLDG